MKTKWIPQSAPEYQSRMYFANLRISLGSASFYPQSLQACWGTNWAQWGWLRSDQACTPSWPKCSSAYFFVLVGISNVEERLIGDYFYCWVEIDSVEIAAGRCQFLVVTMYTLTKVVLPVPDMPMTTIHWLLYLVWLGYINWSVIIIVSK